MKNRRHLVPICHKLLTQDYFQWNKRNQRHPKTLHDILRISSMAQKWHHIARYIKFLLIERFHIVFGITIGFFNGECVINHFVD